MEKCRDRLFVVDSQEGVERQLGSGSGGKLPDILCTAIDHGECILVPNRPMLISVHCSALPRISGVCDGAVSTGLGFEINPVGSFGGKSGVRVAIRPMISVPLLPNRPFPLSKIEILKPIRESD
tara:strand:+ start:191 stop:562 length:372 start_codon:yes stop_codon:yes gene_type:complete